MSVKRMFHWECGVCGKLEIRHDYGMPDGWIVVDAVYPRTGLTHKCVMCGRRFLRERQLSRTSSQSNRK
jgi:predicted RNA-binding Zn-ribbon protein involved in translation (DUF1610 family)